MCALNVRLKWQVGVFMAFFTLPGFAKTFVQGTVWPVKEKNMATLLEERASMLNTKALHEEWQNRAGQYYDRPKPLFLPRTLTPQFHDYIPIAQAYQDIFDQEGHRIVAAGTRINVLTRLPFYRPELYFFNADDKAQMAYAKTLNKTGQTKLILVAGSVIETERALHQTVYFDQQGKLSKIFGIKHLPAHVYRHGDVLRIHEMNIKGRGA